MSIKDTLASIGKVPATPVEAAHAGPPTKDEVEAWVN